LEYHQTLVTFWLCLCCTYLNKTTGLQTNKSSVAQWLRSREKPPGLTLQVSQTSLTLITVPPDPACSVWHMLGSASPPSLRRQSPSRKRWKPHLTGVHLAERTHPRGPPPPPTTHFDEHDFTVYCIRKTTPLIWSYRRMLM
jgi:hypothetical protein